MRFLASYSELTSQEGSVNGEWLCQRYTYGTKRITHSFFCKTDNVVRTFPARRPVWLENLLMCSTHKHGKGEDDVSSILPVIDQTLETVCQLNTRLWSKYMKPIGLQFVCAMQQTLPAATWLGFLLIQVIRHRRQSRRKPSRDGADKCLTADAVKSWK